MTTFSYGKLKGRLTRVRHSNYTNYIVHDFNYILYLQTQDLLRMGFIYTFCKAKYSVDNDDRDDDEGNDDDTEEQEEEEEEKE